VGDTPQASAEQQVEAALSAIGLERDQVDPAVFDILVAAKHPGDGEGGARAGDYRSGDFRTADPATFAKALGKHGLRPTR
jgi:hypothetical protein